MGTAIRVKTQKGGGRVYSNLFLGREEKEKEREKQDQHTHPFTWMLLAASRKSIARR